MFLTIRPIGFYHHSKSTLPQNYTFRSVTFVQNYLIRMTYLPYYMFSQ
jgi:hypothetical protein